MNDNSEKIIEELFGAKQLESNDDQVKNLIKILLFSFLICFCKIEVDVLGTKIIFDNKWVLKGFKNVSEDILVVLDRMSKSLR